jgi:hypothetical protein
MSSSDKMGEIMSVNLRVDPNAIAMINRTAPAAGLCSPSNEVESWLSRPRSQCVVASGLSAHFKAVWLSPEIEAEDIHGN